MADFSPVLPCDKELWNENKVISIGCKFTVACGILTDFSLQLIFALYSRYSVIYACNRRPPSKICKDFVITHFGLYFDDCTNIYCTLSRVRNH